MSSIEALASSFIGMCNRQLDGVVPYGDGVGIYGDGHAAVADNRAIDATSIARIQIGQHKASPAVVDASMLPRHELVGQHDMIAGTAANGDFGLQNGDGVYFPIDRDGECILGIDGVTFGGGIDLC